VAQWWGMLHVAQWWGMLHVAQWWGMLQLANARERAPYSGSGFPLVSGANGSAARPTRKTRLMVTPA
jgi:hypothetical protein